MKTSKIIAILCMAVCLCAVAFAADYAAGSQASAPAAKTTLDNLMAAYNGESNAHARYLAFAQKADAEGYGAAASLFRAAARAEQVHFERHAEVIKKLGGIPRATIETPVVKSTMENLEAANKGEVYENTIMYPEFIKQAQAEKKADALDAFEDAMKAEGVHAKLYAKAMKELDSMKGGKKDFYVCPKCGNVVDTAPVTMCPICATAAKKFMMVN